MNIALYGLFDNEGLCRYVGATQNPKARESNLRFLFSGERKPHFKMIVLRWASPAGAWKIEPQIIAAYWRRGLADWNQRLSPRPFPGGEIESPCEFALGTSGQDVLCAHVADYNKFCARTARGLYLAKQA